MVITEKELGEIILPESHIEKITTISSDGQKLVVRIPKDIEDEMGIKKGNRFRWLLEEDKNKIILTIENGS